MISTNKLMSIGIIGLSIIAGLITFYIISELSRNERKKYIEEMVSQLINFIISIWIGKIIVNFSIFINDPLAILAYPSSSNAFYLAVLITVSFNVLWSKKRRQLDEAIFIESLISLFLVSSFVYEFIQLIWFNNTFAFGYLVVLFILLVIFFAYRGQIAARTRIAMMLLGWSAGLIVLDFIQPFVTVFGYIMYPWFVCLFVLISFSIMILSNRKRG
jgi:hypothetical protein